MELMKLLVARHATPAMAVMAEAGLLVTVLGGVPDLASFSNMAKVEAALGLAPDPVRRLGALGVRVAEDAMRLWQRLRLANAEHDRLAYMASAWWRVSPGHDKDARALLYRLGPERFVDRVLLAWTRSPAPCDGFRLAFAGDAAAALDRARVSAQGRRFPQARPRARARRSAWRCARRKRPGSPRIFRPIRRLSHRSPTWLRKREIL